LGKGVGPGRRCQDGTQHKQAENQQHNTENRELDQGHHVQGKPAPEGLDDFGAGWGIRAEPGVPCTLKLEKGENLVWLGGARGLSFYVPKDVKTIAYYIDGTAHEVQFTPDFQQGPFDEHFRVWIDLNRDGVFAANELLFDDEDGTQTTVTGTITVPLTTELGSARMRVSMAYGAGFFGDYPQGPCDSGQDGEVEDYCVNILEELPVDTTSITEVEGSSGLFGLEVFPVPAMETVNVRLLSGVANTSVLVVLDMQGRDVLQQPALQTDLQRLDVTTLQHGMYVIEVVGTAPDPYIATPEPPYHAVIFTSQRTAVDDGYSVLNDELYAEAQSFDCYIGAETLRNNEGYGVAVLYWRNAESIRKWARYTKHVRAKEQGKLLWYEGYRVRIAKVEREYGMG